MEDADLKARIHRRILLERTWEPAYVGGGRSQDRSGSLLRFFEIIAEVLDQLGKTSAEFVTHDELCEALLSHPEAGLAIERFSREDPNGNSKQWWAANRIASWSQRWTIGRSPYDGPFERRYTGVGHGGQQNGFVLNIFTKNSARPNRASREDFAQPRSQALPTDLFEYARNCCLKRLACKI